MKRTLIMAAAAVLLVGGAVSYGAFVATPTATAADQANAEARTITFAVEKMTCAACPITVKEAMRGVDGVKSVKVDFEAKTATVVFDPSLAAPEEIAAASTNAGYPAHPKI